jgi:ABC-type nickel/cobalt efflux system permease component RcnA
MNAQKPVYMPMELILNLKKKYVFLMCLRVFFKISPKPLDRTVYTHTHTHTHHHHHHHHHNHQNAISEMFSEQKTTKNNSVFSAGPTYTPIKAGNDV